MALFREAHHELIVGNSFDLNMLAGKYTFEGKHSQRVRIIMSLVFHENIPFLRIHPNFKYDIVQWTETLKIVNIKQLQIEVAKYIFSIRIHFLELIYIYLSTELFYCR